MIQYALYISCVEIATLQHIPVSRSRRSHYKTHSNSFTGVDRLSVRRRCKNNVPTVIDHVPSYFEHEVHTYTISTTEFTIPAPATGPPSQVSGHFGPAKDNAVARVVCMLPASRRRMKNGIRKPHTTEPNLPLSITCGEGRGIRVQVFRRYPGIPLWIALLVLR